MKPFRITSGRASRFSDVTADVTDVFVRDGELVRLGRPGNDTAIVLWMLGYSDGQTSVLDAAEISDLTSASTRLGRTLVAGDLLPPVRD